MDFKGKSYHRLGEMEGCFKELAARSSYGPGRIALIFALILSLSLNLFLLTSPDTILRVNPPTGDLVTGFSRVPKVPRKNGYMAAPYMDLNSTVSDAAWDAIELGHGIIHMNREKALEQGLAPSRAWKPKRTEAVYSFSVYHAMHCTAVVRRFLRDYIRDEKKPEEDTWEHASHCMEIIRSEVMCTADGTMYSHPLDPDDRSKALPAGHDEIRQCADWSYLRDWSTKRSAGWLPALVNNGEDQYGVHFSDGDGIIIPEVEF